MLYCITVIRSAFTSNAFRSLRIFFEMLRGMFCFDVLWFDGGNSVVMTEWRVDWKASVASVIDLERNTFDQSVESTMLTNLFQSMAEYFGVVAV